jgi:hypothetical protein
MVVLLGWVTNSLVSNSYSRVLEYAPGVSSRRNQRNEIIMATARMKQPNVTEIIAKDTAPKKGVEALACNDTTVIITSNFIPISASLAMINRTIESLTHLRGLCPTSPLTITVDGINPSLRRKHNNTTDERLAQYVQAF